MKKLLPVLLCLGLAGCMTANNAVVTKEYVRLYNDAVAAGHSAVIIKEGDFVVMKQGVDQQLNSVGYDKTLYTSPTELFVVLVKSIDYGSPLLNGDPQSRKIFLKYTKIDAGHTRIDIVNGGTTPSAQDEVDADIQKLTDLIKKN